MVYNYQIGAFSLQVDADFTITESEKAEIFRSEEPGGLLCVCRRAERVPEGEGPPLYSEEGLRVYPTATGRELVRYTQFPQSHPYMAITESDRVREIYLRYAVGDLGWSTQIGHLFRAISLRHCLIRSANLLLHTSYVRTERGALLFAGEDMSRGLTQAALWAKHRGGVIINGGRAVVGLEDGRAMAYGVPLSGDSEICRNLTTPIRALVLLEDSRENWAERLTGPQALAALSPHAAKDVWRAGENAQVLSLLDGIVENAPVYLLRGSPDERAVRALETAMERSGLKGRIGRL